jgi:alpha,alpha-trehalose phosphorylase
VENSVENDIDTIAPRSGIAAEPWCIRERGVDAGRSFLHETLFTLGNGYIGMRGTPEEGGAAPKGQTLEGTYLNGFYESEPIQYPENAFGLARTNEFMLNVPNAKRIGLSIDGEAFGLERGRVLDHERVLDFRTGLLTRTVEWESAGGKRVRIVSRRLVSCARKHVAAIEYVVTPLNFSGRLRLDSTLDSAVSNLQAGDDPRVGSAITGPSLQMVSQELSEQGGQAAAQCVVLVLQRTRHSGFVLASATDSVVAGGTGVRIERLAAGHTFHADVAKGQALVLHKFIAYATSRDSG